MKMTYLFLFLNLFCISVFAQTKEINKLIDEAASYYPSNDFDQAIKIYKEALKLDKKSPLINHELAFCYSRKGEYKLAIKYADIVIKNKTTDTENRTYAYITKGTALDDMGKSDAAIKFFEDIIPKAEKHYMLHHSLALCYFRQGQYIKAEEQLSQALQLNMDYADGHYLLADIHYRLGNKIYCMLAIHYFLLIEPATPRSNNAIQLLQACFNEQVPKSKSPNVPMTTEEKGTFSNINYAMTAMLSLADKEELSIEETFVRVNQVLFTRLGGMSEEENLKGFYWDSYVHFFDKLAQSDHFPLYCEYILLSQEADFKQWYQTNKESLTEFGKWIDDNK